MTRKHKVALLASTLLVSACGGGGGGGASFIPAPPPAPPPPSPPPPQGGTAADKIIAEATTSQTFNAESPVGPYAMEGLEISYDAGTRRYTVSIPWVADGALITTDPSHTPAPGQPNQQLRAGSAYLTMHASGESPVPEKLYRYSNLATWSAPSTSGFFGGATAFGIATTPGGMPRTGTATYAGFLQGLSSERYEDGWGGLAPGGIEGTIALAFDFGAASLSGSLSPKLVTYKTYDLGTFALSQPVWSGAPSFSATLPGPSGAGLRGTFTGPSAQELIGSFSFGYTSPIDGSQQGAAGAYLAKPRQ